MFADIPNIDSRSIKKLLIAQFLQNPADTRAVAEKFGLWDFLYDWLMYPIRLQLARKDYNTFIEMVFVDPDTMKPVVQQPFQKEWQHMMSAFTFSLIAAPRGHGKTTQVAGRAIWELGTNVNKRIKIVGQSDSKAKEILGIIRDTIGNNPTVKDIFPWLSIDADLGDTKESFFVKRTITGLRDPSVQASGWSATGAGGRADFLIFDDVVDAKNSIINPAQREQVKKVVRETWLGLLANRGKVVWICTPYHQADASHDFKANARPYHSIRDFEKTFEENTKDVESTNFKSSEVTVPWVVWWVPAIRYEEVFGEDGNPVLVQKVDEKGQPMVDPETNEPVMESVKKKIILWPDYWTEAKLNERRAVLGERTFARQLLLNAMSDDERTFLESSLKASFDYTRRDIGDDIPDSWPTFGGVDLASALSDRGAYTVIWTLAMNPEDKKLYLKSMFRKRIKFTQILAEIDNQYQKHKWRMAFVENNAFQKSVEDVTDEQYKHIPIQGFTTTTWNKNAQMAGLPGLDTAFSKGLFAIPAAKFDKDGMLPSEDGSNLAIFMDELRSHPGGEFSDTIMAFWFAYRAAIDGQSNFVSSYLSSIAML